MRKLSSSVATILVLVPSLCHAQIGKSDAATTMDKTCVAGPETTLLPDFAPVARAQANLSLRLLDVVAAKPAGTGSTSEKAVQTIAPASLASVLSALEIGADAAMKTAIVDVVGGKGQGFSLDGLRAALRLQDREALRAQLDTTEGIFVDDGVELKPGIADRVMAELALPVERVDFAKDGVVKVNDLVSRATHGRIPTILDDDARNASLVAVNAFHFKDCWKTAFDPKATADAPFQTLEGPSQVRMMKGSGWQLAAADNGRFASVELPYGSGGYALTLVTTTDAPADAATFANLPEVADLMSAPGQVQSVDLTMPVFVAEDGYDLLSVVSGLGLKAGLDSQTSLSGFADGLALSQISQKTMIDINEAGTEAAAATAATTIRAALPKAKVIVFDKPFVFMLRHRSTGLVAMAGFYRGSLPR